MSILEVNNLTKIYNQGENKVYAVNRVSFCVEQGEFVAVTGQSGSGKTTLLNLLGGIEQPTKGTVIIDGVDICKANDNQLSKIRRQKIGYVFQDFNLIPILTVEENIIIPLLLDGKKPDKNALNKTATFLGIENRLKHLPSELSGGQKQRTAIARALVNNPAIILADEPTGNLDKKMADEIIRLLCDLNDSGITILLVTHEERYADMCKRKLVISDGRIY